MKVPELKKMLNRGCAALLGISISLSAVTIPLSGMPAMAAVTAGSSGYVSGVTYSHNSKFDGYSIVNGIDVSSYQKKIDWEKVKADGIDYAFVRVGFRGYGDSGTLNSDGKYKDNLTNAVAAGVKVGVYIYSQAITVEEAIEEANYILKRIKGYDVTLPVVIDYEYAATGLGRLYNAKLSKREATDICAAFCDTVLAAGYTPMIYANKSMLKNQLYASELEAKYNIWLANYTSKTAYAGAYQYWQYSSSGVVNGITSGKVDCNFFYTTDSSYKNIKIDHQSAEPTDVDASIVATVQNPGGGIVSQVGFTLYDRFGSQLGTYHDSCSYSSSTVSYSAALSDYSVTLTPKTVYYYQPYAKVGSNTYYGSMNTFTTTAPTVEIADTVSVSENNAVIVAELDNRAVTYIEQVGYIIYSSVGAKLGSHQTYCSTYQTKPVFTFDIAAQTGLKLTSGTTYQYAIYTVHDGITETAARKTFKTVDNNTVTAIKLNKSSLSLNKTTVTATLTATVTPAGSAVTVEWSSSDPSVASVDQNGNVTALSTGSAVIAAKAGSQSAECTVTVTGLTPALTLDLTSVDLAIGDVALITPYLEDEAGAYHNYTWTSSNPDVATVDQYGIVIGVGNGKMTVRCTLTENTKVYAECEVTVKQSIVYYLDGGTNSDSNPINIEAGKTLTLSAPTKSGYKFEGWYTESDFINQVTDITLAQDESVSLYAKWSKASLQAPKIKSLYTKIGGKLYIYLNGAVDGAEGYQYVYSTSSNFKTYKTSTVASTSRAVSVSLNKKYYVKVRAYYTDSTGKKVYSAYSSVKSATTASTKPGNLSAVKASSSKKSQLTVAVSKPVSDCYGYQYVIATNSSFTANKQYVTTRSRSYTFTDLPAGTYYVRGRTYNKDKVAGGYAYGTYTSTVKITIKSNIPADLTGITLSSSANGQVTVKANKAVSGATGYQYMIADNSSFTNKQYVNSTKTAYTFTVLEDGTYYVKARAYIKNSSTGKNTYSSYTSVQTITLETPEAIPENLIGVTAETSGKGELTVRVAQPVLSCYGYQYVIASNESFINALTVDTRMRYYSFTDLPKGTYYIKGRTYNQSVKGEGNVYGEFCPVITLTVESDIPESLIGVTAASSASGKLTVAVSEPVLSCYGYQYEIASDKAFTDVKTVDTRYRSYTFSGLKAGTYYVRGRTYDLAENGTDKIYGVFCPTEKITIS